MFNIAIYPLPTSLPSLRGSTCGGVAIPTSPVVPSEVEESHGIVYVPMYREIPPRALLGRDDTEAGTFGGNPLQY